MKLVINKSYGGWGLSHAAILRYCELKGLTIYAHSGDPEYHDSDSYIYTLEASPDSEMFNQYNIARNDPALIQAVEELGPLANGLAAALEVRDLHYGQLYRITEYDGAESLEFPSDIDWEVAR